METLFGRTYDTVGSSFSDFIIKTRGLVKILYGNKFIDVIKNGKLNIESLDFIFLVENKSKIGTKSGIYVDLSDNSIYININGKIIDLVGDDIGTTYVSFLGQLKVSEEQKKLALINIGFLYKTMLDVKLSSIQSGIIFVEESSKLYLITDGNILEYKVTLPNIWESLLTIRKEDNTKGALIIEGTGDSNALIVGDILLYLNNLEGVLDSTSGPLSIKIFGLDKIIILSNIITVLPNIIFESKVISNNFESKDYNDTEGFKLYIQNGESYLDIDHINERKKIPEIPNLYPVYWYTNNNVIKDIVELEIGIYLITLNKENTYKVGDLLTVYQTNGIQVFFKVTHIITPESKEETIQNIIVEGDEDLNIDLILSLIIFLYSNSNILRFSKGNIDLLSPKTKEEELNINNITTRIGNIKEIIPDLPKELGIYTDLLISKGGYLYGPEFKGKNFPHYASDVSIPDNDNSKTLVSSEWVRKLIESILPAGTIVQWNGTTIPNGWIICDGNNGTPNLINKFIKASNTAGLIGGNNTITLTEENLPSHTHTINTILDKDALGNPCLSTENGKTGINLITTNNTGNGTSINIEPSYYSLIFIMKLPY